MATPHIEVNEAEIKAVREGTATADELEGLKGKVEKLQQSAPETQRQLQALQEAIDERRKVVGPVVPAFAQLAKAVEKRLAVRAAASPAPTPSASPSDAPASTPATIATVPEAPGEPTNWTAETMKYGGMAVDAVSGVAKTGYEYGKSTVMDAIPTAQAEYEAVKKHAERGDYIRAGVRSLPTVLAGGIALYCGWKTIKNAWHAVVWPKEGEGGLWSRTKNLFKALGWSVAGVFGAGLIMKGTKYGLQGETAPQAPKQEELAQTKASLEQQIATLPPTKNLMDDYLNPGLDVEGLCRLNGKGLAVKGSPIAISGKTPAGPQNVKLTSITHPAGATNLNVECDVDGKKKTFILDTTQLARILADLKNGRSVELTPQGLTNDKGAQITIVMGPEKAAATAGNVAPKGTPSATPSTGPQLTAAPGDVVKQLEATTIPTGKDILATNPPLTINIGSTPCTIGGGKILINGKPLKVSYLVYDIPLVSVKRANAGMYSLVLNKPLTNMFGLVQGYEATPPASMSTQDLATYLQEIAGGRSATKKVTIDGKEYNLSLSA